MPRWPSPREPRDLNQSDQGLGGEQRHLAVFEAAESGGGLAQQRDLGGHVHDGGQSEPGDRAGGAGQPAEGQVGPGAAPLAALPVVGEELGLVGGHVDVGRAVALAALAGQAQVEGVLDLFAAPAVGDRGVAVAVEHLEQQPRPAPRRVLFLQGDLVGGAHHRAARCCRGGGTCRRRRSGWRPGRTSRRRAGTGRTGPAGWRAPSRRRA